MSIAQSYGRPKILFVTSHWPLAPAYGAQQRVLNVGRMLSRFADVSWVIVPSEPEAEETARRTMREFDVRAVMRPIPVDRPSLVDRTLGRIRHEFDPSYMATDNFVIADADRSKLQELISENDVVWAHTIRTAYWFRLHQWPHSVMDIDDLPSTAYRSTAQSGDGSLLRRLSDRRMIWVWERRENFLMKRFDVLTVCSEADRLLLRKSARVHVIPNGANPLPLHARKKSERPIFGFIGNCGFAPNENGLKWFIREVWPLIKRQAPSAQLRLVGSGSEGHLSSSGPDIVGLGWLDDPSEEIASWSAMIVPIRIGSGTRVKVADGFARKCPIVATSFGVFGYDVASGRDLILADEPGEFASACLELLRDPVLGEELANRAYARFMDRWTWGSFQSTVEAAVQECLARRSSPAPSSSDEKVLQTRG